MQCSVFQCSSMQCSAFQCSAMQCSAVQCSAMQCNAVQCSAMKCSAVQWRCLVKIILVQLVLFKGFSSLLERIYVQIFPKFFMQHNLPNYLPKISLSPIYKMNFLTHVIYDELKVNKPK